ncbi:MAG: sigma-70 family RNA polymerase sigma factor [Acidobacteria bacterium]|nr:sigma-70 family RNA polymerase sigma factor [Acidobacteriota bacterium]
MRPARSIPPAIRTRSSHSHVQQTAKLTLVENEAGRPMPVLHCLPPSGFRGKTLEFQPFDEAYLERLRRADAHTEQHFVAYFSALIQIKLRSRLSTREAIEDVRQEIFARFFVALRQGKILQPDRLGAFVNSMCNNVLLEQYRSAARNTPLDDDEDRDFPAPGADQLDVLSSKETQEQVREILQGLSERDRRLLREVFIEERDKDDVCRDFGVDREYLRVLLHRAKHSFKSLYLKNIGNNPPEFA